MTEKDLSSLNHPGLEVLIGTARDVDVDAKTVHLQDGSNCSYDKLCICTGAVPKVRILYTVSHKVRHHTSSPHAFSSKTADHAISSITCDRLCSPVPTVCCEAQWIYCAPERRHAAGCKSEDIAQAIADSPHVLVLRDRDTVDSLAQRLQHARRIAVVGNGGIAMELAFTLRGVDVSYLQHLFTLSKPNFILLGDCVCMTQCIHCHPWKGKRSRRTTKHFKPVSEAGVVLTQQV